MSDIKVRIAEENEIPKFIKFAWEIYKDDPYWVPPLIMEKKQILNRKKNPFFKEAEIELFFAERDGKIVGRIAAIKNDIHNKIHNENIGFFGFFESINDQEVANALLSKAEEWIKAKGLDAMRGPANPSSNEEWGLLVEGFEDSPRMMMTYNPKYYIELIENYGLSKVKDLNAWMISNHKMIKQEKIKRVADIAMRRSNMTLRPLNMKNFKEELEKVKYVYNKAWAPNWGFIPMTDEEIDLLAKNLKPLVDPDFVLFGEVDGETIGFSLTMPDYNVIFKEMNGRLFPFNFFKLLQPKKKIYPKIKFARIITLGIIPEYQKRGLDAAFYYNILETAASKGIYYGEASWILEDNEMMNRGARTMDGDLYKVYRIYEKKIK
ncbi:MAG: hypothetical protein K8F60_04675 [Melioribacteraceae bacterium]|jgi:GNAT superfamily N-acetyltransferase|nr:hypothetical protein [Melioribacteraceae bacterium]